MGRERALLLAAPLLLALAAPAWADDDPPPSGPPPPTTASPLEYVLVSGTPGASEPGELTASVEQSGLAPNYGYAPLRVRLTNNGLRAARMGLEFVPNELSRPVSRTVELGPGEHRSVVLPVPQGNAGKIEITGPRGSVLAQRIYFDRPVGHAVLAVGTAEQLSGLVGPPVSGRAAKASFTTLMAEELPAELAAYAGFDAVVLPVVRIEDLPQAQARAIEAYAATGGLLVLGRTGPGTAAQLPALRAVDEGLQAYGFGGVRVCRRGSGCAALLARDLNDRGPVVRPAQAVNRRRSYRYYAGASVYPAPSPEHFLLPQAMAPVGRFLLIIVLFTLLVGPGSLLVARRRGPTMLLLTIPATALVTCALIVGYSLVVDGFATHARVLGFTLLDRRHDRAVTVGLGSFYANLSPRGARFGTSSAVLQSMDDPQGSSVDWTEGASFGGDLIPSRTYRELGLLSIAPSRARLSVKRDTNGVRVQNALGARIAWARLNVGGAVVEVQDLADGAEAGAAVRKADPLLERRELREPLLRFDGRAMAPFQAELREGEFVALLEGPGPVPLGGLSLEHHDSRHLIRGEVE